MRPPAVQLRLQPDCGLITWPKSESLHTLFHRSPVCFGCCYFSWQTRAQWLTEKTPFAYQLLHCRSAWHPGCHCDFSAAVSLARRINGAAVAQDQVSCDRSLTETRKNAKAYAGSRIADRSHTIAMCKSPVGLFVCLLIDERR